MTDRILGPAYPALLAPFLPVIGRPRPGMAEQRGVVVGEPDAVTGMVLVFWPSTGTGWDVTALEPADLAIDYADSHTRDRVARALEVVLRGDVATTCPALDWLFSYPSRSTDRYRGAYDAWYAGSRPGAPARLSAAMRLRAVAAAVWGPR